MIEPYIPDPRILDYAETDVYAHDMSAVRGQEHVKRALQVASSGGCGITELVSPSYNSWARAKEGAKEQFGKRLRVAVLPSHRNEKECGHEYHPCDPRRL